MLHALINQLNKCSTRTSNTKRTQGIVRLYCFLFSKSYNAGPKDERHLPFESMAGLFNGSKHLYVNVNDQKGITDAVNFTKSQGVSNITIVGGYEAGEIADFLKQNNVSVFLSPLSLNPYLINAGCLCRGF